MAPECTHCHRLLDDWHGNVMVPNDSYMNRYWNEVTVVCKECSRAMTIAGHGRDLHNVWELRWLKDNTLFYIGSILANLTDREPTTKYSREAIEEIYRLAALAHHELSEGATGL